MIVRLLLVVLMLVPPMLQAGETPVVGPPSISGETVTRVLAGSPLAPYAVEVYRLGAEAGIDPAFALAIWKHESQFGTTGAATRTRNMGNLVCGAAAHPPASGCDGRWAVYPTWLDAVVDWYAYINRFYVARGLRTVEAILPVYAPPSENDTAGYIAQVRQLMALWGSGVVGTAPANPGDIVEEIMDDWLQRPLDELKYWLWHGLATLVWGFNQALLGLVDLLAQFHRLLVTDGFRPAIDAVAEGMFGISRPVFTLGLTLLCLFLILLPVGRLLDLVNARKLIALMLLVPVLFVGGTAGAVFQDLETLRLDISTLLYEAIFTESRPAFTTLGQSPTGSGQSQDLCPILPWNPDVSPALHGDAIAAAYICATRQDVLDPEATVPSDLPDAFAQRYFALGAAEFAAADPAQREGQIAAAASGVGRMVYGVFLTLFALTEALTNLLWTLGLGMLCVALTLVLLFSWFRPYEHVTTVLCHRIMQTFSTSWVTSAIYGLVMAALFAVADGLYAPLVLGAVLGTLVLALVFLWVAGTTVFGALSAAWTAVSGGGPQLSGGVRWAGQSIAHGASAGGAFARAGYGAYQGARERAQGGYEQMRAGAEGITESLIAYDMAQRAGNTRSYSAAYAASRFRPLAQIGTLATAMGQAAPDIERGLYAGHIGGRGGLLNPHAQRLVRRDGAAQRRQGAANTPPTPPTSGGTTP